MNTPTERNWTAHIVISSEHAGLRPHFQRLEAEMLRVLARTDDPRAACEYARAMRFASIEWFKARALLERNR